MSMSDRLRICMTHTTASDCLFFFFFSDPIHAQIMEEPGMWGGGGLVLLEAHLSMLLHEAHMFHAICFLLIDTLVSPSPNGER